MGAPTTRLGATARCVAGTGADLRVRWLGTVTYPDALALQRGVHADPLGRNEDHLLLLEHPPTYTLGRNADPSNVLVDPGSVGAEMLRVDRGGDVTFHGPGQLVAYPIVALPGSGPSGGGPSDTPGYVATLEAVLIDTLDSLGLDRVGRHDGYPGVWVDPNTPGARKVAAIGVRIERGRTLHGVALNVATDLRWFEHIVACGIRDHGVTSLRAEGLDVELRDAVDAFAGAFARHWEPGAVQRSDIVWRHREADLSPFSRGAGPGEVTGGANRRRGTGSTGVDSSTDRASGSSISTDTSGHRGAVPVASASSGAAAGTSVRLLGRLAEAGVRGGVELTDRKPEWMRAPVRHGTEVLSLRSTLRDLDLVTVCEEAGCPNLSECWSEGTATFMVCGERCTRACGFCLVDTRRPDALDADEPDRVAEAVERMGLDFAVLTMVARDDLPDGGAAHVAATVDAIRDRCPETRVEALISDLRGDDAALATVFASRPDVLNHNMETVARLQRAVRPSASYARSLAVLARARAAGLLVKSGLVLGMGETAEEVDATLADLAAVGVSIVTIGQYLRPTSNHLPVARWWTPEDFERFGERGRDLGIAHVESSPFTRSSHHAQASFAAATRASFAAATGPSPVASVGSSPTPPET